MVDAKEKPLSGTVTAFSDKGFSNIDMLLQATGGLSLSQVCAVTGLEGSTIQNWVKRGWVAHPKGKKYEEVHIARILIINALKECIKLEHIAMLMSYVNGFETDAGDVVIKESTLFNYLCDALGKIGQTDDLSRSGVESVVETVIRGYRGPRPDSRVRIRKALSLMIYACVCTDVKRRTEAMMGQILHELANPEIAEPVEDQPDDVQDLPQEEAEAVEAPRKTVSQALREWDANDISSVERVIIDYNAENSAGKSSENEDKHTYRPWYSRKSTKN